jgi:hypothetical protein
MSFQPFFHGRRLYESFNFIGRNNHKKSKMPANLNALEGAHNRMRKAFAVCAMTLMLVTCAFGTVMDGNQFLDDYKSKNPEVQSSLRGYMAGWYDQAEIDLPSLTKCIGPNVKMSQLVDSVALYLEKNPQVRHFHPSAFIPDAIKTQFKCQ